MIKHVIIYFKQSSRKLFIWPDFVEYTLEFLWTKYKRWFVDSWIRNIRNIRNNPQMKLKILSFFFSFIARAYFRSFKSFLTILIINPKFFS